MDREYLKREKQLNSSSEAQVHEKSPYDRETYTKPVRGYAAHPAEKEQRGEAKEMFSLSNSYSNLSVGADRKGDITVAGSAQRRHDSPTLANTSKQVEGSRRKKHHGNGGELFTNAAKPAESAFAYRTNRKMPEKKMLKKLREHALRHGLDRFNKTMPFLDLPQNEKQLQQMRREEAPLQETQAMEKIILDKKTMEMKFLKNLRQTRKKLNGGDLEELQKLLFGEHTEDMRTAHLPASASGEEESGDDEADDEESGISE